MSQSTIRIVDTTLRDGQQSLWACQMRPSAMLPAATDLDSAGFEASEFTAVIMFRRSIVDLKEHPWDWINLGAPLFKNTPLRLHGGSSSRFAAVPPVVQSLFLQKLTDLGITTTRHSDPWNDFAAFRPVQEHLGSHGMKMVLNLIYSVSPRHTVDYYVQKMKEAVALRPYKICFKDVGGLLTVEAAAELLPAIVANAGDIELEFHAHCSNGLAPYTTIMAAKAGFPVIHTAVPPLADGASQPSVFTVVNNLRACGFDVDVDLEPLRRVTAHFERVAEVDGLPVGAPTAYDQSLYGHQVPGGMISNLKLQMRQIGVEHRFQETLCEIVRVREDFGYPIMVTPLAQFVGSQAVLNVVLGERYRTVTDEVIRYCMGQYGIEAVTVMDPDLRDRILARPRARELEERVTDNPTLEEVRLRYGGDITDDDLIVRVMAGVDGSTPLGSRQVGREFSYEDYGRNNNVILRALHAVNQSSRITGMELTSRGSHLVVKKVGQLP